MNNRSFNLIGFSSASAVLSADSIANITPVTCGSEQKKKKKKNTHKKNNNTHTQKNPTRSSKVHWKNIQWMDGWVSVLRPFNSISVISRRWKGEHERLCAMKRRLGSGRISPPAGFEPATPWSEVGSANRSATRTLRKYSGTSFAVRRRIHYLSQNRIRDVYGWYV